MIWKKRSIKDLLPPPVKAEHGEYSMILSARDQPAQLTPELLDLSLKAIQYASESDLGELALRNQQAMDYGNLWPGEHYRLLMGFVRALAPKQIIEIGTSTGLSSLSIKNELPQEAKVITFDITPWTDYPDTLFLKSDFEDGQLEQVVADLSEPKIFSQYEHLIQEADFIFIDATHDGLLEAKLMTFIENVRFQKQAFVLLDDIRVWTMLKMWREITLPKIDLTSFGHWSGTGLVQLPSPSSEH